MTYDDGLLFIIATYKDEYFKCESYISLVESFSKSTGKNRLNIYIADNTDIDNWEISHPQSRENINIFYNHFSSNPGLPVAYNKGAAFAHDHHFKWMVFLDQDTKLPDNFFDSYHTIKKEEIIYSPLVFSRHGLMSPSAYRSYRSYRINLPQSPTLPLSGHSCINSGLLVNTDFFMKVNGYNESLFLDFADHDFIGKLKNNGVKNLGIIDVKLQQDFSSDTHTKSQAIRRYQTFVRDLMSFRKRRNKIMILFYVDFPHLLKLTFQYKSLAFTKVRYFSK